MEPSPLTPKEQAMWEFHRSENLGEKIEQYWQSYLKEQRYIDEYRAEIRRLLANRDITSTQYEILRYNASRGYIMNPNMFVSLNQEFDPDKKQLAIDRIALGFKKDPKSVPPQFRVGKAGEEMAAFSLSNSPIGGPQELASRQFTLKNSAGKTAYADPASKTGASKPDMPVWASGKAVGTVEVKTPYQKATEDPVDYVRLRPEVAAQLSKEPTMMSRGPLFWGPAGGTQYPVERGEGTHISTGYWLWFPPWLPQ
jgi:hypothetical protein